MKNLKNRLYQIGIIPVIKIADASHACPLAQALTDGHLPAAEITFRTEAAPYAIEKMRLAYPDILLGAGTVLTEEQVHTAISAGASFIVAPGFNPKTVETALNAGVPIVPGCITPSEIEAAMSYGLNFVKFFPAEAAGGIQMLKAVGAPYAGMSFMPTGGITTENVKDYLLLKNVICCGGSYIAPEKDLQNGNFHLIRDRAAESAALVETIRSESGKVGAV